jgi:hypothetical protein
MRKMFSIPLMAALTIGSVVVLASLAGLRDGPAQALGSPSAVSTVRAYYAAVNHYIATGEIEAVHETAAPACADVPLLSALRGTYPHMRITIDDVFRDGTTVIAQVSVDAGPAMSFRPVALLPLEHWRMSEYFTVTEGRIVSCKTFGPGQTLVATMNRMTSVVLVPGALVTARISFVRDAPDYLSIPAPAIVSVGQGTIAVAGNGVSVLSFANGEQEETTEPGRTYLLLPGDVLVIPAGGALLYNSNDQPASILATTIAHDVVGVGEAEAMSPTNRLIQRLAAPDGGEVGEGIWVRTLARSAEHIGTGPIELMAVLIVVTPGGSATIEDATLDLVFIPLTGDPLVERSGSEVTILNPGSDQALIHVAKVGDVAPP